MTDIRYTDASEYVVFVHFRGAHFAEVYSYTPFQKIQNVSYSSNSGRKAEIAGSP
jgi:hypothetical protein